MVGDKGLEPSTSRSQTARATNCANPRSEECILDYPITYLPQLPGCMYGLYESATVSMPRGEINLSDKSWTLAEHEKVPTFALPFYV